MNAQIKLTESRDITQFVPILREIDMGDRFFLSMLHWCGIGQRSTPLDYWQVFLVTWSAETVGVCGLYRQVGMEKTVLWLGWLGIRPPYRRQGFATTTVQRLICLAREQGIQELWVYTDAPNQAAQKFYHGLGFEQQGPAARYAPGRTISDTDIVFRFML